MWYRASVRHQCWPWLPAGGRTTWSMERVRGSRDSACPWAKLADSGCWVVKQPPSLCGSPQPQPVPNRTGAWVRVCPEDGDQKRELATALLPNSHPCGAQHGPLHLKISKNIAQLTKIGHLQDLVRKSEQDLGSAEGVFGSLQDSQERLQNRLEERLAKGDQGLSCCSCKLQMMQLKG